MSVRVTCPECNTVNTADDEARGKKIHCRECDHTIDVPAKSGSNCLVLLLVGCGSLVVVGLVSVALVVGLFYWWKSATNAQLAQGVVVVDKAIELPVMPDIQQPDKVPL